MKKLVFFFLVVISGLKSSSQVNIGHSTSPINLYVKEHDKKVFNDLKKTITYFVIPDNFDLKLDQVKNVISEIWTFNKIEFVTEKEYDKKRDFFYSVDKSIIKLINNNYLNKEKFTVREDIKAVYIEFKLALINHVIGKKGELYPKTIAEIFFTPNIRLIRDFVHSSGLINPLVLSMMNYKKLNQKNPEKSGYYNFDLGYIKNYLQILNTKLNKFENLKIRDGIENKVKLSELRNQVLYTPDWILKKIDPMKSIYKNTITPEKQFKDYDFQYKVVSNNELNTKILNKENIYYLMYTRFNQIKILSIINSLSGDVIYMTQENSHNVKPKDLKQISKLIK
ncbi:hypothetical protein [Hyunsoonleella ulvae]|uniref:hypothetical protein n=2 Tax=Flavobacteriaceae TaxID=49546 RepID=UPI00193A9621|nr:hypothetical protein [Hyunsoonleella ulvae]